jgi:hypothetical protein
MRTANLLVSLFVLSTSCGSPLSEEERTSAIAMLDGTPKSDCPLVGTAATQADVDRCWGAIAAAVSSGSPDVASVEARLKSRAPRVYEQLTRDARNDGMKGLWGTSINFDELAHGTIVDPTIVDAINDLAAVSPRVERLTHAGFEHTYGYLLSVLPTSFGYKRVRWVAEDIEVGFELPRGTLGPAPADGTLLSNVTYFAGRIAFATSRASRVAVEAGGVEASATVRRIDFDSLRAGSKRLEEIVSLEDGRTIVLRTDFVPLVKALAPLKDEDGGVIVRNADLLIYSVSDTRDDHARLVTMFPVTDAFVTTALNPANLGDSKPIIARYNAFVDGVSGHDGFPGHDPARTGSRRVIEAPRGGDLPDVCDVGRSQTNNRAYCSKQNEDWALQCCPVGQVATGACTLEAQRCQRFER